MRDAGRSAARHNGYMLAACVRHRGEAGQTVGYDRRGGFQVLASPAGDFGFPEALQFTESHGDRMVFSGRGDRGDERNLVGRSATTFPAVAFATPICIVHLDDASQRPTVNSLFHDLHQFVLDTPSGAVTYTELALEFQCRDAILGLSKKEHREKPSGQRQFSIGKDSPTGQRGLVMTAITLVELVCIEKAMMCTTAIRANESTWPAPIEQRFLALLFSSVFLEEIGQTETFLKLDRVLMHRDFLYLSSS